MEPSSNSTVWRDLLQGGVSAFGSTVATNPALHWQFCKVVGMPFHKKEMWRGISANFFSYLGFMPVAHLSKGVMRREMDRRGWKRTDRSELLIGFWSGFFSVFGVCPGERIAALGNKTGQGNLKLLITTFRTDGIFGLYRGLIPTLARDGITVGGVLTGGPLFQKKFCKMGVDSNLAMVSSSLLIGSTTVFATQPFQVMRIQLQINRSTRLKGMCRELKQHSLKEIRRQYFAGCFPRIVVNVTLVACNILIDDNLNKMFKVD